MSSSPVREHQLIRQESNPLKGYCRLFIDYVRICSSILNPFGLVPFIPRTIPDGSMNLVAEFTRFCSS